MRALIFRVVSFLIVGAVLLGGYLALSLRPPAPNRAARADPVLAGVHVITPGLDRRAGTTIVVRGGAGTPAVVSGAYTGHKTNRNNGDAL